MGSNSVLEIFSRVAGRHARPLPGRPRVCSQCSDRCGEAATCLQPCNGNVVGLGLEASQWTPGARLELSSRCESP